MNEVTLILRAVERGDQNATEELMPLVYEELRRLAASRMKREASGHTLQATALVHEAWLRLVDDEERTWPNRNYFFAAAAQAMRRILVEHARRKASLKHGGGLVRLDVGGMDLAQATLDEKVLLVNDALEQLEIENPERARIVVLKYFSGLSNKEVAQTLGISERTVERQWVCAKAWLFRMIQKLQ